MAHNYSSLDDFDGQWNGRIVRISRLVSKAGLQHQLLAAVAEATSAATGMDRAFVGDHKAEGGRGVVLLMSVWESPDRLRATENQLRPLGFDHYSHLVESWTMEYFEEYMEVGGAGVMRAHGGSPVAADPRTDPTPD